MRCGVVRNNMVSSIIFILQILTESFHHMEEKRIGPSGPKIVK